MPETPIHSAADAWNGHLGVRRNGALRDRYVARSAPAYHATNAALRGRTGGVQGAVGCRRAADAGAPGGGGPSSGALSAGSRGMARLARRSEGDAPARAPAVGGARRLARAGSQR